MTKIDIVTERYGKEIAKRPLRVKKNKLMKFVRTHYSATTVGRYNVIIDRVIQEAPAKRKEIKEFYSEFLEQSSTYSQSIILRIMVYDLYEVLIPVDSHELFPKAMYKLNSHFRGIVDYYLEQKKAAGKDSSERWVSMMSIFFEFVMKRGRKTIGEIKESDVLEFAKNNWLNSSYRKMANQIASCEPFIGDGSCERIASFFPKVKGKTNKSRALSEKECEKIEEVIFNSNALTALQRAEGMLIWLSGARRSDIKDLRLTDVDWDKDRISFIQKKTGKYTEIPLIPVLGNAIQDYLATRPATDLSNLFVRQACKTKRIMPSDPKEVMDVIYRLAGVEKHGTHLVRHRVATEMLHKGTDRATISEYLGHSHPSAVNPYLTADVKILQECKLSVRCYPINSKYYKQ